MVQWLRQASLITLVFQNTATALTLKMSRVPKDGSKELYLVSTALFAGEIMKLIASAGLASWSYTCGELLRHYFTREAVVMLIPAALYSLQNFMQYVAASHLDVAIFQVCLQMKLVTTALFSVAILGRKLSRMQWLGITVCAIGVAVAQLSTMEAKNSETKEDQQAWKGFTAVTISCLTSGLAAAYTEKVFKTGNTSLWVRNMHLASWSLIAVGSTMGYADGLKITEKGFFFKWDPIVWIAVVLMALSGLVVAVVAKYADQISKGFATAVSIIISCVAAVFLFDSKPSAMFLVGTSLVIISLLLYAGNPPPAAGPSPATGNAGNYMPVATKELELENGEAPTSVAAVQLGQVADER
eukprot:Skav208561  [mRNA]  locus=scaffold2731:35631:36698:- [translate_table: standard]